MLRRLHLACELPDAILAYLQAEDTALKAKEALVMAWLRAHPLSQEKAAAILDIDRHARCDLMTKEQSPVIALPEAELPAALKAPCPRSGGRPMVCGGFTDSSDTLSGACRRAMGAKEAWSARDLCETSTGVPTQSHRVRDTNMRFDFPHAFPRPRRSAVIILGQPPSPAEKKLA